MDPASALNPKSGELQADESLRFALFSPPQTQSGSRLLLDSPGQGKKKSLSSTYMKIPLMSCFMLLRQRVPRACSFDLLRAGRSNAAKVAMMAMTTNNSTNVKPPEPVL